MKIMYRAINKLSPKSVFFLNFFFDFRGMKLGCVHECQNKITEALK